MAQFNLTSILVGFILLYLSTFVVFAILRITSGISIQRVGYLSLRRITYVLREGVQIDIRGLGLSLHRPSFVQPTWLSLRITELRVTIDPRTTGQGGGANAQESGSDQPVKDDSRSKKASASENGSTSAPTAGRSQIWKKMTSAKDRIKRLHRRINWLTLVDILAVNTSINVLEVGQLQIGSCMVAVDTRRTMVDRGKLFRRKKAMGNEKQAEWMITVRHILLSVEGCESEEVLDYLGLNIHGILYKDREGLRDASIALKLGRLHVPVEDIQAFTKRFKQLSQTNQADFGKEDEDKDVSFADVVDEIENPGSREENIVRAVADSKEFLSSILRGIQEFELALSFL